MEMKMEIPELFEIKDILAYMKNEMADLKQQVSELLIASQPKESGELNVCFTNNQKIHQRVVSLILNKTIDQVKQLAEDGQLSPVDNRNFYLVSDINRYLNNL